MSCGLHLASIGNHADYLTHSAAVRNVYSAAFLRSNTRWGCGMRKLSMVPMCPLLHKMYNFHRQKTLSIRFLSDNTVTRPRFDQLSLK